MVLTQLPTELLAVYRESPDDGRIVTSKLLPTDLDPWGRDTLYHLES
jgi:hypothetical protein